MKITTKTSDQIAADFAAVFQSIEPVRKGPEVTIADRLAPYRKEVLKQRRRGLTWKQIAAGMCDPRIGEKVSGKTLGQVFGDKPAKPSATPPPTRLILDPATNKPLTPSPSAPAGATPPRRQRLILDPATGKPLPSPAA